MAKILVVDDNVTNRKLVLALLRYEGYDTAEAIDGDDGLAAARVCRPDLVISDILMPSMDGYEFVRQLRADPELASTAVIFYTAHYHELEAYKLAEACRVARVLVKPCGATEFVHAVQEVLAGAPVDVAERSRESLDHDEAFNHKHLQLMTNKLAEHARQLQVANARFTALTELNVQLASERDPRVLLEKVCKGARELLGAKYAVLAVREKPGGEAIAHFTSGIPCEYQCTRPELEAGLLGRVMAERKALLASSEAGEAIQTGLPTSYPRAHAVLVAPLMSLTQTLGWICLVDKVGANTFTAEDENILSILGAQVGRIYENGALFLEVQLHAAHLQVEIEQRQLASARIEHLNRVYAMLSGISSLIVREGDREELFRKACGLASEHGGYRIAWCGWRDPDTQEVKPVAWSGESADLEAQMRFNLSDERMHDMVVAAAMRKQRAIACNDLRADAQRVLCGQEMLARGYCGVVALPLLLETESVGVLVLVTDGLGSFDDAEMRLLTELADDISFALDHIAKSERLSYLAFYDGLTGLANRTLFHERLSQYVSAVAHVEGAFALVIADPERFDMINDMFGRPAGDDVLRQLAQRLVECVGDANIVGRIGANQFAIVVLEGREAGDVARTVEEWWRRWLGVPYTAQGREVRIAARAGIAMFPSDGANAEELLRNAEAALKNAKSTGEKRLFYTPRLSAEAAGMLALEHQLRSALEKEEFVLHYQPKVDLETRRLNGVEALIRWQNPEQGLVPPAKFIPLMEETGMIAEVGAWALRQACIDRSRLLELRLNAPRVAVNVSIVQLRREDFVRTVSNVLRLAGSEAGLDIEVTESLIMDDVSGNIEKLQAVRGLGVGIAIDDFGTGYSSLGYLTKLPVSMLKIDRSFVAAMLDDPGAMTLVSTIISLAHALKLEVVAEGVESEEQAKFLRLLRCDQMQGYLISKPLPFDELTAWLRRSRTV